MASGSTKFPEMKWDSQDVYRDLCRFRQKCEFVFDTSVSKATKSQQVKYVLLWMGDRGLDIYESWNMPKGFSDVTSSWQRFSRFLKPRSNPIMARYQFRKITQDGSLDEFIKTCRLKLRDCNHEIDQHGGAHECQGEATPFEDKGQCIHFDVPRFRVWP